MLALAALALGLFAFAAPAYAGDSDIDQDCDSGSASAQGEDPGDDSNGNGSNGSDEDCDNQQADVDQDSEGDTERNITQRHDDEDDRRRRDDEDNNNDSVTVSESTCSDFSSQADAQNELDAGTSGSSSLDSDNDGRACEDEFTQEVSEAPSGGVETGGGGTLPGNGPGGPGAIALALGPALALGLIVAGLIGLRRTRTD